MTGKVFVLAALASVAAAVLVPSSAAAQPIVHTWVASNGSDGASCDRPTPCATSSGALAKTVAGGEITCVDSGNYGQFSWTISKSVTINCDGAIGSGGPLGSVSFGFIQVSGTAATDVVTLRGLDIDGFGIDVFGSGGLLTFLGAGTLNSRR